MNTALRDQIIAIIDDVQDMTIATVREDGYPQATTVSYVNDGLIIYFGTTKDSQKALNIKQNDKVSLTINRSHQDWNEIEGLSMAAIATAVSNSEEQEKVSALMFEKFPQIAQYVPEDEENLIIYHLQPTVISLLDYSKGFGHTELVRL